MDFGDEGFAVVVESMKKFMIAAVAAIHAHAVEADAELALVADALEGNGWFGEEWSLSLGNTGFFTTLRICGPGLGEIEADINQGGLLAAGETGAYGDLAVFDLTKPPDVLAGYADGVITLFLETGVVDDEPTAWGTAEQAVGPASNFVHEWARFPWGMADGVVDGLVIEIRHIFFHALDILPATLGLHETKQVVADLKRVGVAASMKETTEVFHKGNEAGSGSNNVL
jgi:hypothetical protein